MTWLVVLLIAAVAVSVVLLLRTQREVHRERELVVRVRSTRLYGHLYPRFLAHNNGRLESVTFRPEAVIFRQVDAWGESERYVFAEHGMDEQTPETLYALAQAACVDIKDLRDRSHYIFRCHRELRPNGGQIRWYEYSIRPPYRNDILKVIVQDIARPV